MLISVVNSWSLIAKFWEIQNSIIKSLHHNQRENICDNVQGNKSSTIDITATLMQTTKHLKLFIVLTSENTKSTLSFLQALNLNFYKM